MIQERELLNVKKSKTDVTNNTHCTGDRIKMVKVVH